MDNELYTYLQWRFLTTCHPNYRRYCSEWISNVTDQQVAYFKKEMNNLIASGKYKGL